MLLVTTSWPRGPGDAAGRFVVGHARALAAAGADVRVLAPTGADPREAPGPLLTFDDPGGLFAGSGAPEALARLTAWPAAGVATAHLTAALSRAARPGERVIAHWLLPAGLAASALGLAPLIYAHGSDVALLERLPLGGGWLRGALGGTDRRARVVCVAEHLRDRLCARAGVPAGRREVIAVCTMGVEPPAPDPRWAASFRSAAGGRPIVATVGRLVPIKGLPSLLDALATPALRRRGAVWFAAGAGPLAPALAARAAAKGVDLRLLGPLDAPTRDALLAVADVLVLPSRRLGRRVEGMPVALLEALGSGTPSIATAVGGAVELARLARPGCLRLVPPDDVAALAEAISGTLAATLGTPLGRSPDPRWTWAALGPTHAELAGADLSAC